MWFARNQVANANGKCVSVADFVVSEKSVCRDFVGLYVATVGFEADEFVKTLENSGDVYNAMIAKTLCDCFAEAISEYTRVRVLKTRGACACQQDSNGICVACGYASMPDHTQKAKFAKLLSVEKEIGVKLTSSYMMTPSSSVAAVWIANSNAKYLTPTITKEQLIDVAKANSVDVQRLEKFTSIMPVE